MEGWLMVDRMAEHWWWRPGWRAGRRMYTWHVTFEDRPAVGDLAARYQAKLSGLPGLDLIPARWLHLTTQGVGFTDEVAEQDVAAIIDAAGQRLAGLAPIATTLGPATVTPEAILLNVAPVPELRAMRNELRAAIADVWGPERVLKGAEWTPHVSVAYSSTTAPAAEYVAAVAGSSGTEDIVIDRVRLIMLGRDHRMYEWATRADVPLGTD
jgi:2'-5' RNA ligase